MRVKIWVGTALLVAGVASGAFLMGQPEAQAVDESQAAAVACQDDLGAWNDVLSGSAEMSRRERADALDAAARCGHQVTSDDRELVDGA
jgi:hypothetical protein